MAGPSSEGTQTPWTAGLSAPGAWFITLEGNIYMSILY